jgi:hypothetical protein
VVVISYRRCGTTYRSHLHRFLTHEDVTYRLSLDSWPLKVGPIGCPETSLRSNPEEGSFKWKFFICPPPTSPRFASKGSSSGRECLHSSSFSYPPPSFPLISKESNCVALFVFWSHLLSFLRDALGFFRPSLLEQSSRFFSYWYLSRSRNSSVGTVTTR